MQAIKPRDQFHPEFPNSDRLTPPKAYHENKKYNSSSSNPQMIRFPKQACFNRIDIYNEIFEKSKNKENKEASILEEIYCIYSTNYKKYFWSNSFGLRCQGNKKYARVPVDAFLNEIGTYNKIILDKLRANLYKPNTESLAMISNHFDTNIQLTPIPNKNRELMSGMKEKSDFNAAERSAVIMRTVEYTQGLKTKGIKTLKAQAHMPEQEKKEILYIMKKSVDVIQTWWKKRNSKKQNQKKWKDSHNENNKKYAVLLKNKTNQVLLLFNQLNSILQRKETETKKNALMKIHCHSKRNQMKNRNDDMNRNPNNVNRKGKGGVNAEENYQNNIKDDKENDAENSMKCKSDNKSKNRNSNLNNQNKEDHELLKTTNNEIEIIAKKPKLNTFNQFRAFRTTFCIWKAGKEKEEDEWKKSLLNKERHWGNPGEERHEGVNNRKDYENYQWNQSNTTKRKLRTRVNTKASRESTNRIVWWTKYFNKWKCDTSKTGKSKTNKACAAILLKQRLEETIKYRNFVFFNLIKERVLMKKRTRRESLISLYKNRLKTEGKTIKKRIDISRYFRLWLNKTKIISLFTIRTAKFINHLIRHNKILFFNTMRTAQKRQRTFEKNKLVISCGRTALINKHNSGDNNQRISFEVLRQSNIDRNLSSNVITNHHQMIISNSNEYRYKRWNKSNNISNAKSNIDIIADASNYRKNQWKKKIVSRTSNIQINGINRKSAPQVNFTRNNKIIWNDKVEYSCSTLFGKTMICPEDTFDIVPSKGLRTPSLAETSKKITKWISAIWLPCKIDFYHRLILNYLFKNKINISNESLISLINLGNSNTYQKALKRLLNLKLTKNDYSSPNLTFANYIKKFINKQNNDQDKSGLDQHTMVNNTQIVERNKNIQLKRFDNKAEDDDSDIDSLIFKKRETDPNNVIISNNNPQKFNSNMNNLRSGYLGFNNDTLDDFPKSQHWGRGIPWNARNNRKGNLGNNLWNNNTFNFHTPDNEYFHSNNFDSERNTNNKQKRQNFNIPVNNNDDVIISENLKKVYNLWTSQTKNKGEVFQIMDYYYDKPNI